MTYIFKCSDCDDVVEYMAERPTQCLYGVAYLAGCQHEKAMRGERCSFAAAKCMRLIGIRVSRTNHLVLGQEDGSAVLTWEPLT